MQRTCTACGAGDQTGAGRRKAVISDRFVDSSAVYQGMARGLGVEKIYELNGFAMQGIWPDLTIHLDLPAEVGLARAKSRAELDRMEAQSTAFHEKVAQGYRDLAALAPERIVTIDATQDIDTIHAAIVDNVENCLPQGKLQQRYRKEESTWTTM